MAYRSSVRSRWLAPMLLFGLIIMRGAAAEDPWADAVIEHHFISPPAGFADPAKALGAPTGGGTAYPNNSGVVSLGEAGGYIVLKFDTPVTDDPANPMGLDCIVYSNAFWVGGDPLLKFNEPALIEISADVNGNGLADDPWYVIPGTRNFSAAARSGIANPDPPLAGTVENVNGGGAERKTTGAMRS